ncbi:MAG: GH39 family glycosyl hydrolase, partial [Opitutaceae bacterium]
EPNILYWKGSRGEYFKLYDFAVDGVRRALPAAKVGGPAAAGGPGGSFLAAFLDHCARGQNQATGGTGAPLDFISFHAKGRVAYRDGHIMMGLASQYRDIDRAFAVVASFPRYRRTPIFISECDPESCAACRNPSDGYRLRPLYASFVAASFGHLPELAAERGVNLRGALTWAFEFEGAPPFAGFRVLSTDGIDLPILNLFRLYSRLSGQRLAVVSDHGVATQAILESGVRDGPDVSALACRSGGSISVLAWNYQDLAAPGPAARVTLRLTGLTPGGAAKSVRCYRVDWDHGNPYALWLKLGSPKELTPAQRAALVEAGHLGRPQFLAVATEPDGTRVATFDLPREGIALLDGLR